MEERVFGGSGYLLVPFMSMILHLPMYVIAGNSALAITMRSITSVANSVRLGVELDYALLGLRPAGVIIASIIGPLISRSSR